MMGLMFSIHLAKSFSFDLQSGIMHHQVVQENNADILFGFYLYEIDTSVFWNSLIASIRLL